MSMFNFSHGPTLMYEPSTASDIGVESAVFLAFFTARTRDDRQHRQMAELPESDEFSVDGWIPLDYQEIEFYTGFSGKNMSKALKGLKKVQLIETMKRGKLTYYRLNPITYNKF